MLEASWWREFAVKDLLLDITVSLMIHASHSQHTYICFIQLYYTPLIQL
jgi:hypothetical protein